MKTVLGLAIVALAFAIDPALAQYPTASAVPGPIAGLGLPAVGAYLAYRLYRRVKG